jgi:hypothetical protein
VEPIEREIFEALALQDDAREGENRLDGRGCCRQGAEAASLIYVENHHGTS